MKKVIEVNDLCCERCARRLAGTLELSDGVLKAIRRFLPQLSTEESA